MHAYIYVKLPANLLPFFIGLVPSFSTLFVSIIADEPINGRKRHWSVGASKRDGMGWDGGRAHVLRLPLQHEHVECVCALCYMLSFLQRFSDSFKIHEQLKCTLAAIYENVYPDT